jgi:hypothetical protein
VLLLSALEYVQQDGDPPIYYYYYYYYLNFSLLSFQLGNIHLSWDLIINRSRLGGLIYNLESFSQLNMCQELQIFTFVYICIWMQVKSL